MDGFKITAALVACLNTQELRELRDMVQDRLLSAEAAMNAQFTPKELDLLRDLRKIECIKEFRERIRTSTGSAPGLLFCKRAVEAQMVRMGLNP